MYCDNHTQEEPRGALWAERFNYVALLNGVALSRVKPEKG